MTRIGILITAMFLVFASPAHAIIFNFSFAGVQGFLSDLPDNSFGPADVTVTVSPVDGLGVYSDPGSSFLVNNGAIDLAFFFSIGASGNLQFADIPTRGTLDASGLVSGLVTFTPVAESVVPVPGALPLFATGLGALGLLTWRRKRKAA